MTSLVLPRRSTFMGQEKECLARSKDDLETSRTKKVELL